MTFGELIVFNSTIPTGLGTVLQHLSNIQTTREAVNGFKVSVVDSIIVSMIEEAFLVKYIDDGVYVTVDDAVTINIQDDELGVNI